MAIEQGIETKAGREIQAATSHAGDYCLGDFLVSPFDSDLMINLSGHTVSLSGGMLSIDGKRVLVKNLYIDVPFSETDTQTNILYIVLNMAQPTNLELAYAKEGELPFSYRNDNLFELYETGVKFVPVYKFKTDTTKHFNYVRLIQPLPDIRGLKDVIINAIYPVGSTYISMSSNVNPNNFLVGTWELAENGRYMRSETTSGNWGKTANTRQNWNETNNHTLTVAQMPRHTHTTVDGKRFLISNGNILVNSTLREFPARDNKGVRFVYSSVDNEIYQHARTEYTGSTTGHSHQIPTLLVGIWKRIR